MTNPANRLLVAHLQKLEDEVAALRADRERQKQLILSLSATISQLEITLAKLRNTSKLAARHRVRARQQWERAERWKHTALREQAARDAETAVATSMRKTLSGSAR